MGQHQEVEQGYSAWRCAWRCASLPWLQERHGLHRVQHGFLRNLFCHLVVAVERGMLGMPCKERTAHPLLIAPWVLSKLTDHVSMLLQTQRFKECRLLQHDGRQRALAYVGISSSATMPDGKPWGGQVVALVDDWDNTYYNRLTPQHRTVRLHSNSLLRVYFTQM